MIPVDLYGAADGYQVTYTYANTGETDTDESLPMYDEKIEIPPYMPEPDGYEHQECLRANREWFVRFQYIAVTLAVFAKVTNHHTVAGRRVTRQHKTRQVKNL